MPAISAMSLWVFLSPNRMDEIYNAVAAMPVGPFPLRTPQLFALLIISIALDWTSMEKEGLTEDQKLLKEAFETYGVKDYIILDKNGVKIAITGIFGEDCLDCVPNCPLEFKSPVDALKETVATIRTKENVDMINDTVVLVFVENEAEKNSIFNTIEKIGQVCKGQKVYMFLYFN